MKARCSCTLEDKKDGSFVKPQDGYLEPDNNCKDCDGTGFLKMEVGFPSDEEIESVWIPICRNCGEKSMGFHFQLKGELPPNDEEMKPACLNCENGDCHWIKES